MSLMDWLRKLGILRSGVTTATYKDGAERPTELMMDGVFDAKKDLVTGHRERGKDEPKEG